MHISGYWNVNYKQDLCNIEKGRTQVSLERAKKFAKVLGYGEPTFASYVLQDMLDRAGIEADLVLNEKKSS